MYTDTDVARPRLGQEPALGRLAVARLRPGHADARRPCSTRTSTRTTSPTTASPGCRRQPRAARSTAYVGEAPPVASNNFYGLRRATTRTRGPTWPPLDFEHDFGSRLHAAQPAALRPQRPRLGDHRAALREPSSPTLYTQINRQLQSRDMTDTILSNQTSVTAHASRPAPRSTRSSPASTSAARTRSTTCARAPRRRSPTSSTPNPDDALPGPDHAHGRRQRRRADRAVGRTPSTRSTWARSGSCRAACATTTSRWTTAPTDVAGRGDAVRAHRRHVSLARRRRLQAAPVRQRLRRHRHLVQPLGGGAVAHATRSPTSSPRRRGASRSAASGTCWTSGSR